MLCLSVGSNASLASFLLLMCLKKNLSLLFTSLQVFFLKICFSILPTFNLPILVAFSDNLSWTGLQLYEGILLALNNFPLSPVQLCYFFSFRIDSMHLMRASDILSSNSLYDTYKNFMLWTTPITKSQNNSDLIPRESIIPNGSFFHV